MCLWDQKKNTSSNWCTYSRLLLMNAVSNIYYPIFVCHSTHGKNWSRNQVSLWSKCVKSKICKGMEQGEPKCLKCIFEHMLVIFWVVLPMRIVITVCENSRIPNEIDGGTSLFLRYKLVLAWYHDTLLSGKRRCNFRAFWRHAMALPREMSPTEGDDRTVSDQSERLTA